MTLVMDRRPAAKERLASIDADVEAAKERVRTEQRKLSELLLERERVLVEVAKEVTEPRVSDHAIVRYLERKHGFDFDAIRAEILTPDRAAAIRAGATSIRHDGVKFVVKDGVIVTTLPN